MGLLHDGQVDNHPVWFRILTHDQSSTDFSWLVTGVDLDLVKVDGNHLLIDLSLVLWWTEQSDCLDHPLLPLFLMWERKIPVEVLMVVDGQTFSW